MADVFKKEETITIAHLNIRGWLSNNALLYAQLCLMEEMPDIVVINESKLNKSVRHPALAGYTLIARRDHGVKQHGGGVLMFVINRLSSQVTFMGESKGAERTWIMVHTAQGPYLVGAWYRSPSPTVDESIQSLQDEFEKHRQSAVGTVIVGDLNVHHSSWLGSTHTTAAGEAMRLITTDNGLKQIVRGPTHEHGNRLDLVFTSMPDITRVTVGPRVTDHHLLLARLKLPVPRSNVLHRQVHDYAKADWDKLRDSMQEELWTCIDSGSVDEAVEGFTEAVRSMVDAAVPQKAIVEQKGSHPWIDQNVLEAVQARNGAVGGPEEIVAAARCSEVLLNARQRYQERTKAELAEMPCGSKQ